SPYPQQLLYKSIPIAAKTPPIIPEPLTTTRPAPLLGESDAAVSEGLAAFSLALAAAAAVEAAAAAAEEYAGALVLNSADWDQALHQAVFSASWAKRSIRVEHTRNQPNSTTRNCFG